MTECPVTRCVVNSQWGQPLSERAFKFANFWKRRTPWKVNLNLGLQPQDKLPGASIWPLTSGSELETCGALPSRPFNPLQLRLDTVIWHMSFLQFVLSFLRVPKWCAVAGVRGRLEPGADATLTSQSPHGALTGRQLDSGCLYHQVSRYINILYTCHWQKHRCEAFCDVTRRGVA